jgi:SAM-dependent methyltransferase
LIPKNAMSAERHAARYPVQIQEWFEQDRLHSFNYRALSRIVGKDACANKVLDWGCGNGLWALGLFPNAEITGVEIDRETLSYAEINARGNGKIFYGLLLDEVSKLKSDHYDVALAMGLIELINDEEFLRVFDLIFRALKPGGKLICTLHNWRAFNALYLPWIMLGGYEAYCSLLGTRIQKKSLKSVENDFKCMGYQVLSSGGYNPYPSVLWPYMVDFKKYLVSNKFVAHWCCSQYITVMKPLTNKER